MIWKTWDDYVDQEPITLEDLERWHEEILNQPKVTLARTRPEGWRCRSIFLPIGSATPRRRLVTDTEHAQELEFLLYRLASESRERRAWDSLLRAIQVLTGVGHPVSAASPSVDRNPETNVEGER